jgi:hypothetical protein
MEKTKLFVGIQVRKQSFDASSVDRVLDDLVQWAGINSLVSIDVNTAEDLKKVAEACARRSIRYFPAKFEWAGYPGSVDALGKAQVAQCPLDIAGRDARLKWYQNAADALPETAGGVLVGHEERMPPLDWAMRGNISGCFCEQCVAKAKKAGVDPERAKTGFLKLHAMIRETRDGRPPADGAFTTLFRIMTAYPEMQSWNNLWMDSLIEVRKDVREIVKGKRQSFEVGIHIFHHATLSPFFRANYDYEGYVGLADWVKPSIYHDCGGARFKWMFQSFQTGILSDMDPETALKFLYSTLQIDPAREPGIAEFEARAVRPFTEEYVAREVKRGVTLLKGRLPLYAGIGVDIPTADAGIPVTPESVYKATQAAIDSGAQGIMICRHFDEMKKENVEAVKQAIKDATR